MDAAGIGVGRAERVLFGVVVPAGDVELPEGTEVVVVLPDSEPADGPSPGVWSRLATIAAWAEVQPSDLPEDLAENHDHDLHGRPKRRDLPSSPDTAQEVKMAVNGGPGRWRPR